LTAPWPAISSILSPTCVSPAVTTTVATIAFVVATFAVMGVETDKVKPAANVLQAQKPSFREAFAQVWAEPAARRFTIFIFVSMLAYSAQELLVEPFAALPSA